MSHVGPGWSPTWRTHSCVPCRDSSRHLLCSLTWCASHARGPGVEKSLASLGTVLEPAGDLQEFNWHTGAAGEREIRQRLPDRRSELETMTGKAGGEVDVGMI